MKSTAVILGSHQLLPQAARLRIEVRRLMYWFNDKFFADVSGPLTEERYRQYMPLKGGGGSPDHSTLREVREILPDHLAYISSLLSMREWLANDQLTYADLAAAAHLSTAEYLREMRWPEDGIAKSWYARIQSRPSFRSMHTEAWRGSLRSK